MGLPKKLTERQIKFAELLVYNEAQEPERMPMRQGTRPDRDSERAKES